MRRALAALAGAAATTLVAAALRPCDRRTGWVRTNYRGRQVSLAGGVATAAGATAAAAVFCPPRARAGAVLGVAAAGGLGLIDDRATDPGAARGLKGHLGALRRGQVTTGVLKLVGIPAASVVAAACLPAVAPTSTAQRGPQVVDLLARAGLIAGTANLLNLFDLRPGRALKAGAAPAAVLTLTRGAGASLGAGALGVIAASWPGDLAERTMLGDTGANALGALVGTGLALVPCRGVRVAALGAVATLVVVSEKVSFSAVIDQCATLRRIDSWGRRQ